MSLAVRFKLLKIMAKTSRLDITLNDQLTEVFNEIQKEEGITRAEVVRRAVAYYRILRDQKSQDKKVLLVDEDGSNQKELVLI